MAESETQLKLSLTELEKAISNHFDADVKNRNRLSNLSETNHNTAIANVLISLINAFPENKIVAIIEAEMMTKIDQ